ncbi:MAG: Mrp/NBP35 family ATP-binding protein [Deltaproteobacteria bacterium]
MALFRKKGKEKVTSEGGGGSSCPSGQPGASCKSCSTASCPSRQKEAVNARLARIRSKIVVMSGKGGVGKSTVAATIARGLARRGRSVGLLDVDFHGPSLPRILGAVGKKAALKGDAIIPVQVEDRLSVMSLGFLLPDAKEAVIWRGPIKMNLIKQFLEDVDWGDLDYLVVDCPPGTGDEPLSVLQTLGSDAKAVIVTTPQAVAVDDVRRSITFCEKLGNAVLGVVENMSGFRCPGCGQVHDLFGTGGGKALADEMGVPFLGSIPLAPAIRLAGDQDGSASDAADPAVELAQGIIDTIEERAAKKDG